MKIHNAPCTKKKFFLLKTNFVKYINIQEYCLYFKNCMVNKMI